MACRCYGRLPCLGGALERGVGTSRAEAWANQLHCLLASANSTLAQIYQGAEAGAVCVTSSEGSILEHSVVICRYRGLNGPACWGPDLLLVALKPLLKAPDLLLEGLLLSLLPPSLTPSCPSP